MIFTIDTKLLLNVLKVIDDGNNPDLNKIPVEAKENIFDFAFTKKLWNPLETKLIP